MKLTIKEQIDYNSKVPSILAKGNYKGTDFLVMYVGNHPCAYIQTALEIGNDNDCPVHGGFTWVNDSLCSWDEQYPNYKSLFDKKWLGWDYAHIFDYMKWKEENLYHLDKLKKWTTDEIIEEITNVIDWMITNNYLKEK